MTAGARRSTGPGALALLALAALLLPLAGCSDDLVIPDFNNPSLEDLENMLRGQLVAAHVARAGV